MLGKSTYARLFIGFSPDLSHLIIISARQVSTSQTNILPITILSEDQVSQALADPQNQSLKILIAKPYADSLRASIGMIKGTDEAHHQKMMIEAVLHALDEQSRISDATGKERIDAMVTTLNNQYKHLTNIEKAYEYNQNELTTLNTDISDLAVKNDSAWRAYRSKYLNAIAETIPKIGLKLPQGEVDNLLRQDAWQEVKNRFIDTGASKALPAAQTEKILAIEKPSFETYFKLKAFLAVYAISSSHENMGGYLKQMDNIFKAAAEEGQQLTNSQEAEVNAINETKIQPILKVVKSDNEILHTLETERTKSLENIVTRKTLDSIQEKVQAKVTETPEPLHISKL